MKNIILLLCCLTTLSITAQKIDSPKYTFTDGIEFQLHRFMNAKTAFENNVTYVAKKGTTYKTGMFEFTNTSNADIEVNFEKIFLLDSKNNKYFPNLVVQAMKMNLRKQFIYTLKPGKTKTYGVEFWPPFPKDETPRLMVNDEIIELPAPKNKD